MRKQKEIKPTVNYDRAKEALKADALVTSADFKPIWLGEEDTGSIYDPAMDEHGIQTFSPDGEKRVFF